MSAFFSDEGLDSDSLNVPPIGSEDVEDSSMGFCAFLVVASDVGAVAPPIGSVAGISFAAVEVGELVATGFPPPIGSGSTDSTGSRARALIEVRVRMRRILCFM